MPKRKRFIGLSLRYKAPLLIFGSFASFCATLGIFELMANFVQKGRTILAIGRNYADHAKELGNEVPSAKGVPVFFLKPVASYVQQPNPIVRPVRVKDLHHEVELGLVIGKKGKFISAANALDHIAGYTLALDMTARDLQDAAKKKGLPWSEAKGYDTFTAVSQFLPKNLIKDPQNINLWLKVDGAMKQKGNTKDMIFSIPEVIAFLSTVVTLDEGDLILTGTPAGVGPVLPGQTITAGIEGLSQSNITFSVVDGAQLKNN